MGQALTKKKKKNKKGHKYESKEEYFIKNGNILLEKQIALGHGRNTTGGGELKIVSANDIESAINHYPDPYIVIESGFQRGIGYKGSMDGRVVWIWVSLQHLEPNPILTEAAISLVMNHSSMGKLYGCCLETFMPILVYEFLPIKSLFEYLHGSLAINKSLKWVNCLRVATDASYALSYMHNSLSKPVVHRAVSSQVLGVDDSLYAKLGMFAYSVMIDPWAQPKDGRWRALQDT